MSFIRTGLSLAALTSPSLARQYLADYWPLAEGHTWTSTDSTNPNDNYPWTVLSFSGFQGQPAWPLDASGGSAWYLGNDGTNLSFYGAIDTGVPSDLVPGVVIGAFSDVFLLDNQHRLVSAIVGPIEHQGAKAEAAGMFDGPREDVGVPFAVGTNCCVAGISLADGLNFLCQ